jgi:hypothetical protein
MLPAGWNARLTWPVTWGGDVAGDVAADEPRTEAAKALRERPRAGHGDMRGGRPLRSPP